MTVNGTSCCCRASRILAFTIAMPWTGGGIAPTMHTLPDAVAFSRRALVIAWPATPWRISR
jgi:hypothetical protein